MKSKPTIRFVEKKDLPELVNLCKFHAIFEKADYDTGQKVEKLNKHLFSDNPSLFCLVVEKKARLIGYASYMRQFSTWDATHYLYMDCLFLTEESRGFGIGEELIHKIKAHARELACSLIQWQTPEFNKRAMKFYERIGAMGKTKVRYFLNV